MTNAQTAVEVVDWRRRVFALYEAVRRADSPEEAHELWRIERDELLLRHPATPLLPQDRALFEGLPIASYDPAWRFELPILDTEPATFEFATGTDGIVPFERVGVVEIPDVGSLDVWRLASYGGGLFVPVRDSYAPGRAGGRTAAGGTSSTRSRVPTSGPTRAAARSCSTSTSRTTRPAPTTRRGRARWRHPATC